MGKLEIETEFKLRDEIYIFDIKNNKIVKDVIKSITVEICFEDGISKEDDVIIYTFLLNKELRYYDCYNNNIFISKDYDTLVKNIKDYYNNEVDKVIENGKDNIKKIEEYLKNIIEPLD